MAKALTLVALLVLLAAGICSNCDPTDGKPIHLGCEIEGLRLWLVNRKPGAKPHEPRKQIVLTYGSQTSCLRGLKQLWSAVRVGDGEAALRLVRLLTAPATWNAWAEGPWEVEVLPMTDPTIMPSFGLSFRNPSSSEVDSRSCGILSLRAYEAGGFTPALVEPATRGCLIDSWTLPGNSAGTRSMRGLHKLAELLDTPKRGFLITRWILSSSSPSDRTTFSVQKVQEFVGQDGEYRRTVLQKMAPPSLPGTTWRFPSFG